MLRNIVFRFNDDYERILEHSLRNITLLCSDKKTFLTLSYLKITFMNTEIQLIGLILFSDISVKDVWRRQITSLKILTVFTALLFIMLLTVYRILVVIHLGHS